MLMRESVAELKGLAEDTARDYKTAKAGQRKTKVLDMAEMALEQSLASDGIVPHQDLALIPIKDDGVPPIKPAVTLTPIMKGLIVEWPARDSGERVKSAQVRYTPSGGSTITVKASSTTGHTLLGLEAGKSHSVSVNLTDAFGDESGWSTSVTATPLRTAAEEVDLTALSILGRINGLLPNANLATIQDATKLGSGVVLAQAMAVQDAAAINLWVQNGAFQSAKISGLVVDKLVGGTLSTSTITVASRLFLAGSGQVIAGPEATPNTTLDSGGVSLREGPDYGIASHARNQKISPITGEWGALAFFDDGNIRGVVVRSDGDVGVRRGVVALHATKNGNIAGDGSARVEVESKNSGFGVVNLYRDVWVQKQIEADNFLLRTGSPLGLVGIRDTANSAFTKAKDAEDTLPTKYPKSGGDINGDATVRGVLRCRELYVNGKRVT